MHPAEGEYYDHQCSYLNTVESEQAKIATAVIDGQEMFFKLDTDAEYDGQISSSLHRPWYIP